MKKIVILLAALLGAVSLRAQGGAGVQGAQDCAMCGVAREGVSDYKWEIGVGGSAMQFPRIWIGGLADYGDGYNLDMDIRHVVWAGNVYAGRMLSRSFVADFQGSVGAADDKLLLQAGLGLQYRVGHYFGSRQVDPYLRVGGNYLYKGFDSYYYDGEVGYEVEQAGGRRLFTVAIGAGTNLWLNDRVGVGLQGDYILTPKPDVGDSMQGTVRVIWRF